MTPHSLPFNDTALRNLCGHIHLTWNTLTRDLCDALSATRDSKVEHESPDRAWPLYLSPRENMEAVGATLAANLAPAAFAHLSLRVLPADWRAVTDHGLLYLPGKYVVPGGRFNEMHGWDSHFIVLGLLRSGRLDLARSMVDQQLYQIEHYGTILNANRTYFLTRSHPPFLGRTLLEVYRATGDMEWLRAALPLLEKYYFYWSVPPHLIPSLGLARYYDFGEGPAPEVEASEKDANGRTHYERAAEFLRTLPPEAGAPFLTEDGLLTDHAWRSDRAMRESGFDPGFRFGPLDLDTLNYLPVCLNTLLWRMETDIAAIRKITGATNTRDVWLERAAQRRQHIDHLLWDEAAGLYSDYHLVSGQRSTFVFATTFWPLWAGLASREQAAAVAGNLHFFETPGGIQTGPVETGCQWDGPFGWAPVTLMAVQGLNRYGYREESRRIAVNFISMVEFEFNRTGRIFEKYDTVRLTSDVAALLKFGYPTNETGFGWTNAAVLELLHLLGVDVLRG